MHKSIDLFAGIGGIRRGFDNAFKDNIETVFVNHENQQEVIEVDDFVRQGDYKYMYSDSSIPAMC